MGSLADLKLPTETVSVPGQEGQSFTVRGLSIEDVSSIFRRHAELLEGVWGKTVSEAGETPNIAGAAKEIVATAPMAAAEIIATATGEPELFDIARQLPVTAQIDALRKIAVLTFQSEEELGKLLETVVLGSESFARIVKSLVGAVALLPGFVPGEQT